MRPARVAAVVLLLGASALGAASCAEVLGIDTQADTIDFICKCDIFNYADDLEAICMKAAAAHDSPDFLKTFVASKNGVACPDCTHAQECLRRLEIPEENIPCKDASQCNGSVCCLGPNKSIETCCATCGCST